MTGGGLRQAGAAFAFRDYRRFWIGAVVSNIGTWMQNVTVPYVLYELTGSGTWVGLAIAAQVLPSILLNPLAGSLADRFSRRKLLMNAGAVQAVASLALALLWASGTHPPGAILALVAVGGTAAMTTAPAWQAFVTDLVPPEHLLNAVTLNSAQANAARAVGPAIGGVVLGSLGAGWAFGLNALSFAAVLLVLASLHLPDRTGAPLEGGVWRQYREAAAFARRSRGLLTAYAVTTVVCACAYPVFQLATLFAQDVYELGPGWYGALTGTYGAGAVLGALVLGMFGAAQLRARIVIVVMVVLAVSTTGFGLATSFWAGAPLLGLVGAGTLAAIATLNSAIQTGAPERLRGRVLALWVLSYSASYPLGSVLQGWLADQIGARATVAGAGVVLGVVAVLLLVRPALADALDGDPDVVVVDPVPATG